MTTTDHPNLMTVPDAEIPAQRAQLVAEAEEIVTRSTGDALGPADTDRFAQIEQAIGFLDYRAKAAGRTEMIARAMGPLAGALAQEQASDEAPRYGNVTPPGPARLAPITFTRDALANAYDAYRSGRPAEISATSALETRAMSSTTVAQAAQTGYVDTTVDYRREPTRIASYLPTRQTTSPTITYYSQGTAASAAAAVAEGAAKPESDPAWSAVVSTVRKLAHWTQVSSEVLADFEGFADLIEREMIAGLINTENTQLISGSGVAPNLLGLLNTSGILTYAPGSAEPRYRSIRTAMRMLRAGASYVDADVVVMNPADTQLFDLANDTTAGLHAVPNLQASPAGTAWGVPIVVTTGIASGTALVANLGQAATLYVREAPRLFVDPYGLATSNMVRILAEERLALAVSRPTAVLRITFNGTA
jgi:HK97 family phage major capsid protein